jgi:hypothetical protein
MENTIKLKTHRFIFSESFISHLYEFSKIHQYDERKIFKSEWEKWTNEETIREIINEEIHRLSNQGFKGDILNKMFTSARYYFRKKSIREKESKSEPEPEPQSEPEPEPNQKKQKERIPKEWLTKMDHHILQQVKINTNLKTNISEIKPYDSFIEYCNQYKIEIIEKLMRGSHKLAWSWRGGRRIVHRSVIININCSMG